MRLTKIPFSQTQSFTDFFLDYIQQKETLKSFYNRFPTPDNFSEQLKEKEKSFKKENRQILTKALQEQYKGFTISPSVSQNLELLKSNNSFTITTGHQLNICTGPLYFIYKIVTVINACKKLKEHYPEYNFIPVFWMASEDHDYEEIKSFRLFGNKYTWETKQSGAIGRFSTEGLPELMNNIPGDGNVFKQAYKHKKLNEAVRFYVNELFQDEGLVIIDGDSRDLKSLFKDIVKDDIIHHTSKKLVEETNARLEDLGYKTQVYCREINFFYLDDQLRSRIEERNNHYEVIDSELKFSKESILKTIDDTPEKFSPNVILRPLYQEVILPNLAYVGGPAEVVYWLQLKDVFGHYKIPFPILMPRNFALIIESHIQKKLDKTGLQVTDLFEEKNLLFNQWVLKNSDHELSVSEEFQKVTAEFEKLLKRSQSIDSTLGAFVGAEEKRVQKSLERIEQKMIRAMKRKKSDKLRQIETVKDQLFPNGGLQERVDNFLNFYSGNPQFIKELLEQFDPFDFQFNILTYK